MHTTRRILAVLLVISTSCATRGVPETDPANRVVPGSLANKHPYIITTEELRDPIIQSMNLATAIRQLRPTFFRDLGPQSFSKRQAGLVQVSHDYGPLEPVSQLSGYNTLNIVEIRYLNANEAENRFGLNANGGPVIVLLSNKVP
jgi:hypothetical protein